MFRGFVRNLGWVFAILFEGGVGRVGGGVGRVGRGDGQRNRQVNAHAFV